MDVTPTDTMNKASFIRFFYSLLVPPVWTVLVFLLLAMDDGFTPSESHISLSPSLIILGIYPLLIYFAIPGLLFWIYFEWVWRKKPEWTQRWSTYASIGAAIGLAMGALISFAPPWYGATLPALSLFGALTGFITASICFVATPIRYRRRVIEPQEN